MTGLNADTLTQFFYDTRDELMRFFQRRLDCPETAADLAQETYLRLHENQRYSSAQNLRALAFHIAGNLSIDHIRRRQTRDRFIQDNDWEDDTIAQAPSQQPGPERDAIAREALSQLHLALDELPEESRTALYLSTVDHLSYAQIAQMFGVSERMVARRIADALKHCRARRGG